MSTEDPPLLSASPPHRRSSWRKVLWLNPMHRVRARRSPTICPRSGGVSGHPSSAESEATRICLLVSRRAAAEPVGVPGQEVGAVAVDAGREPRDPATSGSSVCADLILDVGCAVAQQPKHWSGLLPATTVRVNVAGDVVKSPPP